MPTSQLHAKDFNPNALNLVRVASYDRKVNAPLVRAWENVLDWAHLPHLHSSTFDYVAVADSGNWGWRTWSNAAQTDHVELTIADTQRYVVRSYLSGQQVSEIWTTLTPADEHTDVHVDFYLPDIEATSLEAVSSAILSLYTQLWDEDEAMMRQRHHRLHEQRDAATEVTLGSEASLLQSLQGGATVIFQLKKQEFQLRERNGTLIAHTTICPHLLGPLTDVDLSTGKIRCPWHGYQFDIESGECVVPRDASCRLAPAPRILEIDNQIVALI